MGFLSDIGHSVLGDDAGGILAGAAPLAFGTSLLSGGLDYVAGQQNRAAQKNANDQNIQLSRDQMAFQERMSSTAHQREVQDLMKAGLNPMLSANAGASSPSGSITKVDPPQSALTGIASSAKDSVRMAADMYKMNQDIQESKSRARMNNSAANLNESSLPLKKLENYIPKKIMDMFDFSAKTSNLDKLRDRVNPSGSKFRLDNWALDNPKSDTYKKIKNIFKAH